MRILYFHFYYSTKQGTTGTRSYHMAKALAARGHQVTIACASWNQSDTGLSGEVVNGMRRGRVEDFDVIEFVIPYDQSFGPMDRLKSWLKFAKATVALAKQNDYDLLFATSTPLTVAIPGIFTKRSRGKRPFVLEVRDLWPELPRALGYSNPVGLAGMNWLEKSAYDAADGGIGLSPGIVDGMVKGGMKRESLAMIPNGCDLDTFRPAEGPRRFELPGVEEGDFIALFTGTHGRANGLGAILDAAAELKKRGITNIRLVFIGKGGEKAMLVKRAEDEGLDNCVFHDAIPKVELAKLCAQADVGLMCLANVPGFYYGTSPNKFFDYLASGLPVLVNYPGWMTDMVKEHDLGQAVPPENPSALADALIAMRDNPSQLEVQGRNARALGEREFDWRKLGEQFCDHLEAIYAAKQR
jgi:glycosyltransferase involved in cell wall biosynthesis